MASTPWKTSLAMSPDRWKRENWSLPLVARHVPPLGAAPAVGFPEGGGSSPAAGPQAAAPTQAAAAKPNVAAGTDSQLDHSVTVKV